MKRRHFLASLFGALVASKLALELTAKEPVVCGLDLGFEPQVKRFIYSNWMGWTEVRQFIQVGSERVGYEKWILNPDWNTAGYEYCSDWPMGGVPQPRNRLVDNPYAEL